MDFSAFIRTSQLLFKSFSLQNGCKLKSELIDLEEETVRIFETLVTTYQSTRRHIPNYLNLEQPHCENLRPDEVYLLIVFTVKWIWD